MNWGSVAVAMGIALLLVWASAVSAFAQTPVADSTVAANTQTLIDLTADVVAGLRVGVFLLGLGSAAALATVFALVVGYFRG